MKFLLLLSMLYSLMFSQSIEQFAVKNNYETNYESAIKRAKQEGKDLMFVLVSDNCGWCKRLEKQTLSDEDVQKEVHKKYIPLILSRSEHKFPSRFNSSFVPVIHFINYKNDNYFVTLAGFRSKNDFLDYIE